MRRVIGLAAAGALAWRLVTRRHRAAPSRAVVGYDDGSAVALEPGSAVHERLVEAASDALRS